MRKILVSLTIAISLTLGAIFTVQGAASLSGVAVDEPYAPGPDSLAQPGVPKGEIFTFVFDKSRIYPGTARTITVYVPAQYRGDKPACVYVGLDGLLFNASQTLDSLIFQHEVPVIIAIGVSPGIVNSMMPAENPRFDRSAEFDSLDDTLARFLLEEVLPEVKRKRTAGGLPLLLSDDANDRAIAGASTGAVGAFTVAWEHPEAFRRVFTAIGTFVGMRGADRYAVLIRKTEPKPLRIFMQDGRDDELPQLGEFGDWWLSNQTIAAALSFAGYESQHAWGEGSHDTKHATFVFPDAMRWLWKDWPQPLVAGESHNSVLKEVLQQGEAWKAVAGNYKSADALAVDLEGKVVFRDAIGRKSWQIDGNGRVEENSALKMPYSDLAFGPTGQTYLIDPVNSRIEEYQHGKRTSTVATGIRGTHLLVTASGSLYVTTRGSSEASGEIWRIDSSGKKTQLDGGLKDPTGVALSPDGLWLAVAERRSRWGFNYRVMADGGLSAKTRFYWLHVPDDEDGGTNNWVMDTQGRLYAGTRMGVQVLDRNGRVRAILPVPGGAVTTLAFGGPHFSTLYVSCADNQIYGRKMQASGHPGWAPPTQLPPWFAG